jgi:hypothetical protein
MVSGQDDHMQLISCALKYLLAVAAVVVSIGGGPAHAWSASHPRRDRADWLMNLMVIAESQVPQASGRPQSRPRHSCQDELGKAFSTGAMRKVAGQIQKCDTGKWVLGATSDSPKLPVASNPTRKSCLDKDQQEYGHDLVRRVGVKIEKCDNGKWREETGRDKKEG